jgi:hypothetical protein
LHLGKATFSAIPRQAKPISVITAAALCALRLSPQFGRTVRTCRKIGVDGAVGSIFTENTVAIEAAIKAADPRGSKPPEADSYQQFRIKRCLAESF